MSDDTIHDPSEETTGGRRIQEVLLVVVVAVLLGVGIGYLVGIKSAVRTEGPDYVPRDRLVRAEVSDMDYALLGWSERVSRERYLTVDTPELPPMLVRSAQAELGGEQLTVRLDIAPTDVRSDLQVLTDAKQVDRGEAYAELCRLVVRDLARHTGVEPEFIRVEWMCMDAGESGSYVEGELRWSGTVDVMDD